MLYSSHTFSFVIPIGVNSLCICSWCSCGDVVVSVESKLGLSMLLKFSAVITSIPPAITVVVIPLLIDECAFIIACNPLLHKRLTVYTGTVCGIDAITAAAFDERNPAPFCKALPMIISSIVEGLSFVLEIIDLSSCDRINSGERELFVLSFVVFIIGERIPYIITGSLRLVVLLVFMGG